MKAQTLSLLPARVRSVVRCGWWLPIVAVWIAGCALEPRNAPIIAPLLSDGVEVVLPNDTHAGLVLAAEDVSKAIAALNGGKIKQTVFGPVSDASTRVVVFVEVLTNPPDAVGAQGFEISRQAWGGQRVGLRIRARTAVGAMYGLFTLAHDLGVRYLHPEETFWPAAAADASLPWQYPGDASNPSFGFRGLHEHTQHPTPASDFLLKPDDPTMASYASRWLQWIARNRNNVASFHLLKTVPLKSWVGAFGKLVKQAHSYGIKIGFVTSFADQQQNNYKHIDELDKGADGKPKPDDQQIRSSLDTLLSTGIDWIGFQLGTSEFSKPKDSRVMSWIEVALAHISTTAPGVKAYAWIHTTCNLLDEKGGYYYHLPLQADASLGAWVHTTMFYTLTHPAPVYHCEDFSHQMDFFNAASGERELVYFPETAWWLGFDNNLPLAMPITGWSRAHDIQQGLAGYEVDGHVTFTTGREWGYWRYDHHVLGLGWDRTLDWDKYLRDIEPVFGGNGVKARELIHDWTELQRQHFYEETPEIFVYIAGELPQDEIGQQAGIIARKPKPAFQTVLNYDNDQWQNWQAGDLATLRNMEQAYASLMVNFPAELSQGTPQQQRLFRELERTYRLYVQRITHTIALYEAVVAMRPWRDAVAASKASGKPADESLKAKTMENVQAKIDAAKAITAAVTDELQAQEKDYRYPVELLARPKPDSLTAYPFGYLEQTSTGYFWTRRDVQIEALFAKVFDAEKQQWSESPQAVFVTNADQTKMVQPDHPLAANVLASFMPRLLVGLTKSADTLKVQLGQDSDDDDLPDVGAEQQVNCIAKADRFVGKLSPFSVDVFDSTGTSLGTLNLLDSNFDISIGHKDDKVLALNDMIVAGQTPTQSFLAMMMQVGGIDKAGASALVGNVFGLAAGEPLPATLNVTFRFTFSKL